MLAITKGLAPSVKGYVLLKDPKTLDELIECAKQPSMSNHNNLTMQM